MVEHKVAQGDCITSIAADHGFFWKTLWDDPANAELKESRQDPNVLMPGDIVVVPDLREKHESTPTEKKHQFKLKGVPAKFKVRLLLDDAPRANEPYQLIIDGKHRDGTTDGDGFIELPIPPSAREGRLIVGKAESQDVYALRFGSIDPLDTDEGVRSRLHDLGFDAPELSDGVKAFQDARGLEPTGSIDQATRSKLKESFGQ